MTTIDHIHFASGWEAIADAMPGERALSCAGVDRTWREYEARAARLASYFTASGIGHQGKIGIYLHNCNEYLETHFAALKMRAVPINVNYRYTTAELQYLLDNCDAEGLVYHARYRERVRELLSRLPGLKAVLEVDDGTADTPDFAIRYESALAGAAPAERVERSAEDLYMFYTGGTTGMPKGVMYHIGTLQNAFLKAFERLEMQKPQSTEELVAKVLFINEKGGTPVSLPACPLMHATGMWIGAVGVQNLGAAIVTLRETGLDAARILGEVQAQAVTNLTIVGDAFARPLVEELDRAAAAGSPYDLSSLKTVGSSGTMWSQEVKEGLLRHADVALRDTIGSTEGGMGMSESTRGQSATTARFDLNDGVRVFDENDVPVAPGSGVSGQVATSEMVPVGYYKDPEKSARTFREIDGVRYSFPGDWAMVLEDGTIHLLGRGSACINTAGEKVYPEEVEEALKKHSGVTDCLVVGLPDERFGQRVVAVAVAAEDFADSEADILETARAHLAGYKLPKQIFMAPYVQRSPSGKPDYPWAREFAAAAAAAPA